MIEVIDKLIEMLLIEKQSTSLLMELEWVKEMWRLSEVIKGSSVRDCFKNMITLEFLYSHKFEIDEEILSKWVHSLGVKEVSDAVYTDVEALDSLLKLIKDGEIRLLNE
mmetsp:Transcript_8748/g.8040  ORF Transcript_8748/g.8040 Transcript_8748/m.8040 type:complete len:109 (+) Transcript_8748:2323-2649(+)